MRKHDVSLIKKAAIRIVEELEKDYSFVPHENSEKYINDSVITLAKNKLIMGIIFHAFEGRDFYFLENGQDLNKSVSMITLKDSIFPTFSQERKAFSKQRKKEMGEIDINTSEFYYRGMQLDIQFLKEYFPEILSKGLIPPKFSK